MADGDVYEDNGFGRGNRKHYLKFDNNRIIGLFNNEGDAVGNIIRSIGADDKVVVSQGLGAPKDPYEMPLRVLAYVVPVLHLLKQLPRSAIAEIYIAAWGTIRANQMTSLDSISRILSAGVEMRGLIEAYVRAVHSDLEPQVRTMMDERPSLGSERAVAALEGYGQELCSTDESVKNFVMKRGGQSAMRYMVEHALYMREPLASLEGNNWLLVPGMSLDMKHLIMVGGPAEKVFYKMRQRLRDKAGIHNRWTPHQLWTSIGDPPTYSRQPGEPLWPPLDDLNRELRDYSRVVNSNSPTNLIRDFLVLLADAASQKDFRVKDIARRIAQGGEVDAANMEWMQRGWEIIRKLRSF